MSRSREDLLDDFAVEPIHDKETLDRYLRSYPRFAADLIDLSRELGREVHEDETPLSPGDSAMIYAAWRRHTESARSEMPGSMPRHPIIETSPSVAARLSDLMKSTGATSEGEVVYRALAVLEMFVEVTSEGSEVFARDKSGQETRLKL